MRKRKLKRTAGQRRYHQLRQKANTAISKLEYLQRRMQTADGHTEGARQLRQMLIMQEITEVIERLK
jgi:hypothetical protein